MADFRLHISSSRAQFELQLLANNFVFKSFGISASGGGRNRDPLSRVNALLHTLLLEALTPEPHGARMRAGPAPVELIYRYTPITHPGCPPSIGRFHAGLRVLQHGILPPPSCEHCAWRCLSHPGFRAPSYHGFSEVRSCTSLPKVHLCCSNGSSMCARRDFSQRSQLPEPETPKNRRE